MNAQELIQKNALVEKVIKEQDFHAELRLSRKSRAFYQRKRCD
ncbi:hypothetical protein BTM449_15340 [Helicobacter pylori]